MGSFTIPAASSKLIEAKHQFQLGRGSKPGNRCDLIAIDNVG
jgi:hypothetical protein